MCVVRLDKENMAVEIIGYCSMCGRQILKRDGYFCDTICLPIYMCVCREPVFTEIKMKDGTTILIQRARKFEGNNC